MSAALTFPGRWAASLLLPVLNLTRVRCEKWRALISAIRGQEPSQDRRLTACSVESSRQTLSNSLPRVSVRCFAERPRAETNEATIFAGVIHGL